MPEPLISFLGTVSSARDDSGPLGLTLQGATAGEFAEYATVAFSGTPPDGLPAQLQEVRVVALGADGYGLLTAQGKWALRAAAVHVHRDVSAQFYRALPPRGVPLAKRCMWALVLRLAASRSGLALLAALRR